MCTNLVLPTCMKIDLKQAVPVKIFCREACNTADLSECPPTCQRCNALGVRVPVAPHYTKRHLHYATISWQPTVHKAYILLLCSQRCKLELAPVISKVSLCCKDQPGGLPVDPVNKSAGITCVSCYRNLMPKMVGNPRFDVAATSCPTPGSFIGNLLISGANGHSPERRLPEHIMML